MRAQRRWVGMLLVLGLAAAACSSSDDTDTDTDTDTTEPAAPAPDAEDGSTIGLTDDTIRMSAIIADIAPLVEAGLAPDFGDFEVNFQVFIDEINEAGGLAGRQIEMGYHFFSAGSAVTEQQASCLGATQDDDSFLVIFTGGTLDETVLCVTEQNERLALVMAGAYVSSAYELSEGRLFTNGIEVSRLMRNMVEVLDDRGELDDRTLGVVRDDLPREAQVAAALGEALAERGYELAEDVALPCEGNVCEQNDVGAQRLMSAGVDAVFSLLGPTTYPAFVGEAGAQGFTPQWFSSDFDNQVTETTATFFEGPAEIYDGAIGTTTMVVDAGPDPFRAACNERFTAVTGTEYEPDTDAWRAVGNSCEMLDRVARVIEAIDDDGLPLNDITFIEYMENERVENGDRQGDFRPDKHDAYDVLELQRFSADCICWEVIEGSRWVDES